MVHDPEQTGSWSNGRRLMLLDVLLEGGGVMLDSHEEKVDEALLDSVIDEGVALGVGTGTV